MSSTSFSFAFRPGKKIDLEFVRVLQEMAVHARRLTRRSRGTLSESIHRTRVLIKRLRALLWFANQTLPSTELTRAKSGLRKASHLLAPQRDQAVMQSTLKKLARDAFHPDIRLALARISRPSQSQQVDNKKMEQSLRQASATIVETIDRIERSAKTCSGWPLPSDRLVRAFHAMKKTGKKALESGKAAPFHNWRKKTKRLLYQLQLAQPAPGRRMARIIKRVDKLQDILGACHDSVVVQYRLRNNPPHQAPVSLVKCSVKLLKKRRRRLQKKARKTAGHIKSKLTA